MASQIKRKTKSLKIWLISIGCLVIAITYLAIFQRNLLYLSYYYITADHFNKGDKVYLKNEYLTPNSNYSFYWRLIRPLTTTDTLDIDLDVNKKLLIRSNTTDSLLKTYLVPFRKLILDDSLKKNKSAGIGYYLFHSIFYLKGRSGTITQSDFIGLKIDPNVCDPHNQYFDIPQNYVLADSVYYILPQLVSNKEALRFQ